MSGFFESFELAVIIGLVIGFLFNPWLLCLLLSNVVVTHTWMWLVVLLMPELALTFAFTDRFGHTNPIICGAMWITSIGVFAFRLTKVKEHLVAWKLKKNKEVAK